VTARTLGLGRSGEDAAAAWYAGHGYEIVARNWRCPVGEIDLIAVSGRTTVICEVKTRTSAAYGLPAEAVTAAKQARLRRLAASWLASSDRPRGVVRFDVAAVLGGEVEVIEGAF
jgi:putative endonuclease